METLSLSRVSSKALLCAAVLVVIFAFTQTADAAGYLKIGDIKGESTDSNHDKWIDILSVSQGIDRPSGLIPGAARRRGSANFQDIIVTKEVDASTPKLMEAIATGEVFPELLIDLTDSSAGVEAAEGRRGSYFQWKLENVRVTSFNLSGPVQGSERPNEQVAFNYEKIKVVYHLDDQTTTRFEWVLEGGGRF